MSKRPIRVESSSAAHKRQAAAPENEGPLPSASVSSSSSSSLAQQASSLSIPKIPTHLIADLILPFVPDRATWKSVYSASKDLWLAAKKMTPPWPNKAFNLGRRVQHVAFSPSGSQLAFCINNYGADQFVVLVWDRWGKETLLEGHTEYIHCLEYSLDGEHLASGSGDGSIRIWSRESCDTTSSQTCRERPTRTPKQADKILLGRGSLFITLSFSRTDSNVLASGGPDGEIKVWNIKERACMHSFNFGRAVISALFFSGGADITCLAAARSGSVIRLWRAEGSPDLSSEPIGEANQRGREGHFTSVSISPYGSFLANNFHSRIGNAGFASTLAIYELETMTKTQSVVMPGFMAACVAVSPDSKQLVYVGDKGRIQLFQTDDFSIHRDLDTTSEDAKLVCSVAFDPTCRVLAFGCDDGRLELRSL
jgi:WD40 repeat protein